MFNLFDNKNTKDFEFLLDQIGSDVTINGTTPLKAVITNTPLGTNFDDRKIATLSPLERGDIVLFNGQKYMIISEINGERYNKYKGIMRRLTHSIIVNSLCRFYTLDCFIITSNLGVIDGQVLSLSDGEIRVYSSQNNVDYDLKIADRFLLDGQAFKITGVDTFSKPGMVILTCDKDQIDPVTDDVTNNIAGGLSCPLNITNTEPIEVFEGQTLQLTWTTTQNEPVIFISSDESIATVDASGLVTGISIGQVTITIKNATNGLICDSVTVNVIEVPASYTINITSTASAPNEIKIGQSKTYNAEVHNGTVLITDGSQPVTWQLFADDQVSSTTLATITSQNGTSCTVKNNNANSGYVQLRAMLQSNNTVVAWIRIQMKPLF